MRIIRTNIDIRSGYELPIFFLKELENTAWEIRNEFVTMLDNLSTRFNDNLDWWVSKPASRDIFFSSLFYQCCILETIKKLKDSNKYQIEDITTDSNVLSNQLKDLAGKKINVKFIPERKSPFFRLRHLRQAITTMITPYILSLLSFPKRKIISDSPLILIDTFVFPNNVQNDRYFPGMLDLIKKEKEKENIYFVPTFQNIGIKNFLKILKELRGCKTRQFILKEDYLKLSDYIYAFLFILRRKKLRIPETKFLSFNITEMIKKELNDNENIISSFIALLNYRFALRLKNAGVKLKLIINWFENQVIDKGWNSGFTKYYPDIPSKGYQGMLVSDHWLHKFPTKQEREAGILPKTITVPGKKLTETLKEFDNDANIIPAPAFRFKGVFEERKTTPDPNIFSILIALPISLAHSLAILKSVYSCCSEINIDSIKFIIKRHPLVQKDAIKEGFGNTWPDIFEFVEGGFNECIEKSNLLISSTSSVCLEALAKGVPVIIAGELCGLTYNPIPKTVPNDYWTLCYTSEDYINAINQFREKTIDSEYLSEMIIEEYFYPITPQTVKVFLNI